MSKHSDFYKLNNFDYVTMFKKTKDIISGHDSIDTAIATIEQYIINSYDEEDFYAVGQYSHVSQHYEKVM